MAIEIPYLKEDGTQAIHTIEDGNSLDFKKLGVAADPDQLTERIKNAKSEGYTKAEAELNSKFQQQLEAAKAEREDALNKLNEFKTKLPHKEQEMAKLTEQITALTGTVKTLTTKAEEAELKATRASLAKQVADSRASLKFVEGGAEIYDRYIESRRQEDGTYLLNTGMAGTLAEARDEWLQSGPGKALTGTAERGGGATSPPFAGTDLKDREQRRQRIKQMGKTAYANERASSKS